MATVRVKAAVKVLGLQVGPVHEVERTALVEKHLAAGLLVEVSGEAPTDPPAEQPAVGRRRDDPASTAQDAEPEDALEPSLPAATTAEQPDAVPLEKPPTEPAPRGPRKPRT